MEQNTRTLSLLSNKSAEYKVSIEQRFVVNDKPFVNTTTEIGWLYRVEVAGQNPIILLKTTSYQVHNNPSGFEKLVDFGMLFNKPAEEIVLELTASGDMMKVVNQGAIFERWKQLANTELAPYQSDPSMEGIFIAGHTEFSDTMKSLKANLLYVCFFDEVYGKPLHTSAINKPSIGLPSKLFQGTAMKLKNRQEITPFDTKMIAKNFYRYFAEDNKDLGLEDRYQRDYKDATGADFEYEYGCSSEAQYDLSSGLLDKLRVVSTEKANDRLTHETKYKVEAVG